MQKILVFTVFIFTFTIAWCFPQRSNILTFDESLSKLEEQNERLLDKYSSFFSYDWTNNQDIDINISSLDAEYTTDLMTQSKVSLDFFKQNHNSQTEYYINMFDKKNKQKIMSSWNFFYSNIDYVPYFKLNQFNIDLWTWNMETKFLKLLLGWIIDRWIMVDIQNRKNLIDDYIEFNYVLKDIFILSQCQMFYKIKDTIRNSKLWYKIWLDQSKMETCLDRPIGYYSWIIFEGYLAPLNKNQVSLLIEKLSLPNKKDFLISLEMNYNDLDIDIYNTITKQKNHINIKYNSKHDKISFVSQNNNFQINLDKTRDYLIFDWNLLLPTKNINKTETRFKIEWKFTLQKTWHLDIKAPQNYLIMSQLLWDKFSLKNIIGQ